MTVKEAIRRLPGILGLPMEVFAVQYLMDAEFHGRMHQYALIYCDGFRDGRAAK